VDDAGRLEPLLPILAAMTDLDWSRLTRHLRRLRSVGETPAESPAAAAAESPATWAPAPPSALTTDAEADRLVRQDAFAFLLGALLDHGMSADRAWRAPLVLQQRLGHLDPERMAAEPEAVQRAVADPPVLHRYKHTVASWIVAVARRVVEDYDGEAAALWSDAPTRNGLLARLVAFEGFGEVKARKTIEHLERAGIALRDEPAG
jgi:uncharacterized HhH-GPD family protein